MQSFRRVPASWIVRSLVLAVGIGALGLAGTAWATSFTVVGPASFNQNGVTATINPVSVAPSDPLSDFLVFSVTLPLGAPSVESTGGAVQFVSGISAVGTVTAGGVQPSSTTFTSSTNAFSFTAPNLTAGDTSAVLFVQYPGASLPGAFSRANFTFTPAGGISAGSIAVNLAVVPEPASLALLAGALAGLVALRRRA